MSKTWDWPRRTLTARCLLAGALLCGSARAGWALGPKSAQPPAPDKAATELKQGQDALLGKVGIRQRLGDQIPADLEFTTSEGKVVALGDLFGERPVVLALVYYECPMLCTMVLNGMLRTMNVLKFDVGTEYDVVTVSIDARETPMLAADKKKVYLERYRRPGAAEGWSFLVGSESSIEKLAEAVGYRYAYDPETDQFAHGSAIVVLTPEGRISQYFYGIDYSPVDVRLALVEASSRRIGTFTDAILLTCFQYNPLEGTYSFAVMRVIRFAGVLTVLGILVFIGRSVLRERRRSRIHA